MRSFLPSGALERSDMIRALRLYGTRIFLVGNPMIFTAVIFSLLAGLTAHELHAALLTQSLEKALKHANVFNAAIAATFVQNCLQTHSGNQIGASQAPAIPGLLQAEARAASLMSMGAILALSGLLAWSGLPLHDTLFYTLLNTVPAVIQWYAPPQQTSRRAKGITTVIGVGLLLGLMLLTFATDFPLWALTRPALLTIPADLIMMGLLTTAIITLPNRLHSPAMMASTDGFTASPPDFALPDTTPRIAPQGLNFYQLRQMLLAPATPTNLRSDLLTSLFMPACAVLIMGSLPLGHGSFGNRIAHLTPGMTILIALQDAWISNRKHWPLLLTTGRFGSRLNFVRAVFTAKANRVFLTAPLRTLSLMLPATLFKPLALSHALLDATELLVATLGVTFCCPLPFLVMKQPPQSVIIAATVAPAFVLQLCNPFILGTRIFGPVALAFAALGTLCFLLVPSRMARIDWPYETE
ncbi:ABC transporter permease [Gluconobacter sphaericus]|uniref:ABC transporter permease n=1 Tax=Gluconobacter sphaericus TaxID=574987 RepID=UPI001B8B3A57|nr:ABC transporter permease [Gluconobacter sphaericus]MBS1087054.1 ABC transporter permease [Gluconobacter sphaericus]MBS1101052.1 ABC transporter permease [Gluconobacter sphaericus]